MAASDQVPLDSGFGRESEPEEVLADVDLAGRIAVVTGGYSGIGVETTRALAGRGARVMVPVRDAEKARETLADVDGEVSTVPLDLADLGSVRALCDRLTDELDHLDLLINNAGIMACPEGRVGPGWERQIGVNHFGHFALTEGLMPLLAAAEAPRVVSLSSIAHRGGGIIWDDMHFQAEGSYERWRAYAQSKTANALFAVELSKRLAPLGGLAFSVHPGGIFTPLQRHLPLEDQVQLGWRNPDGTPSDLAARGFKSPTQGASTTLWAATSPQLDGMPGVYCEDVDVAALWTEGMPQWAGVREWAVDEVAAERLWSETESALAEA